MKRTLERLLEEQHFPGRRMAFVVGPRQVGKTTIAKHLLARRRSTDLYRNWDDLEWRREVARAPYAFLDAYRATDRIKRPLLVLDEIHKHPRWKRYVKGLWDTRGDRIDVLVTGSGRLDVYQRGGDSLLGRYHQYRLHPLSVREVVDPRGPSSAYDLDDTVRSLVTACGAPAKRTREAFSNLLRWGGFPVSFLSRNDRQLRLWQRERRERLLREDLRDLSRIQLISHVEELVEMLVARAGGILSLNSLREDLGVALDSVRLWVSYLERLYFIYLTRPFAGRIARALRREPKVYLWDWSDVSDEGSRFENMVASHLLKWCHFTEDFGYTRLGLSFVRDKEKREVDFLVTRDKKPWLLVETKASSPDPGRALRHFGERLGVEHRFLVVANLDQPGRAGDVRVLDGATFLACLPV